MYDILQLNEMLVPELKEIAEQLELKGYKKLSKQDLIYKILDHQAVVGGNGDSSEAPKAETKEPAKEEPKAETKEPAKEESKEEPKEEKGVKISGRENRRDKKPDARTRQRRNNDDRDKKNLKEQKEAIEDQGVKEMTTENRQKKLKSLMLTWMALSKDLVSWK